MSNLAPGGSASETKKALEDLAKTVKDAADSLTSLTRSSQAIDRVFAETGRNVLDFATNVIQKAGANMAKDVAFGVLGDVAKFGSGALSGGSVESNVLRSASSLPVVGDLFAQVQQPLERAAGRTLGVTGAIARAGGRVTPDLRASLFDRFEGEEGRAQKEQLAVEQMRMGRAGRAAERQGGVVDSVVNGASAWSWAIQNWLGVGAAPAR